MQASRLIGTIMVAGGVGGVLLTWWADPAALERLTLGVSNGSLSWGPVLFRMLLLWHSALLIAAGVWHWHRDAARHVRPARTISSAGMRAWGLLAAIAVVALLLRLWHLNTGMWIDEILMYHDFAARPMGQVVTSFPSQNQHMLYSVLARLAFDVFGESVWAFRLPAVVFGVLSIGALFLLGRRLISVTETLLACTLMTLSYHHVWFSQSGRGYTGQLFFATITTWLLMVVLERRQWRWPVAYAVMVGLGLWVHLTLAFVFVVQGGACVIRLLLPPLRRRLEPAARRRHWVALGALCLGGTLALQLYALALPEFLREGLHEISLKSQWTDPRWLIEEAIRSLHLGVAAGAICAFAVVALAAGAWGIARRNWVSAVCMTLPAPLLCVTMVALGHNLWPRFVFFAMGFLLLVAVHGVMVCANATAALAERWRMPMPWVRHLGSVACMAGALLFAAKLPRAYNPPKQDYGGARDYVISHLTAGDQVLSVGLAGYAYSRYYAPDWPVGETAASVLEARQKHRRVWLLYTMPVHMAAYMPDVWRAVQRDFHTVKVFPGTLGGGDVYVCLSDPLPAPQPQPADGAVSQGWR